MYPFYLELELVKPVSEYFIDLGYTLKHEVRIGFCRADLVGFKDGKVISVELKLRDYKKAIIQAKNYQLGSDYAYIACPLARSYNILKKAKHKLEENGIGLLVVNEKSTKVKEVLKPKKSKLKFCSITIDEIERNKKKRGKFY